MPALTTQQLNDGALDLTHIQDYATSFNHTAVDRLGTPKITIAGASSRINLAADGVDVAASAAKLAMQTKLSMVASIVNRGNWAATTNYNVMDVAYVAPTWYLCLANHTSSASFATDSATKWRVHQVESAASLTFPDDDGIGDIAVSERQLRVSQSQSQLSFAGGYTVVDPKNAEKWHTSIGVASRFLLEHVEEGRVYNFRVYPNSSYSAIIDLGTTALIAGAGTTTKALELRAGESISIVRAAANFFYIVGGYFVDYELSDEATFAYSHTGANSYTFWRRVTVNAGATATFSFSAAYTAASVKRVMGIGLVNNAAGNYAPLVVTAITDANFSVHNPNGVNLIADITIGNLKKANA